MGDIQPDGIRVTVSAEVADFYKLGGSVASGYNTEQADFLFGFSAALRRLGPSAALMQLEYITQALEASPSQKESVLWFASNLTAYLGGIE